MLIEENPSKDHEELTKKAYEILREAIVKNSDIEPNFWFGACISLLGNAYINGKVPFESFENHMLDAISYFKKRWPQ